MAKALLQAGFQPIGMEDFMARAEEPFEACLQEVAESDLLLGIYAWRYGFVPSGHPVSITEEEILEARRRKKPCFCFVVDESHDWPAQFREEGDGARKLRDLKRWIGADLVTTTFTTPEDLATRILATLLRWKTTPTLTDERRRLLKLLDRVRQAWIDGVLEPATEPGPLAPERRERLDLVASPWEGIRPPPPAADAGLPLLDLFRRRQRTLLILGKPGAAKTAALLRLLRALAAEAERAPEEPVPVYFDLASWPERRERLAQWLAREIHERHHLDLDTARRWIEDRCIVPLLDGLDEIEREHRPACEAAIEGHLEHFGEPGIVVSCRTQEYEDLPELLKLDTAVELQPLTPEQVDQYLALAGEDLAPLRASVRSDAELRDLAQWPLPLDLLARTFHGAPAAEVAETLAGPSAERLGRVLTLYVEHMKRRPGARRYSPERTESALAGLARGMKAHNLTLFQIEELQPSWLSGSAQLWAYTLLSRGLGGLLLLAPAALLISPAVLLWGLTAGLFAGLVDQLSREPQVATVQAGLGRWALRAFVLTTGALGLAVVFRRAAAALSAWPWPTWLLLSVLLGLLFGFRPGGEHDTRVFDEVKRKWSRRGALSGAGLALALALAIWVLWRASTPETERVLSAKAWVPFLAVSSLIGALAGGFVAGLEGKALAVRTKPNLGIRQALKNAGRVGLWAGGALTLLLALVMGGIEATARLRNQAGIIEGWWGVLWIPLTGIAAGLWVGLWFSGMDVLQHFTLRLLLTLSGRFPASLPRFLVHACERGFLRRAGGSYVFVFDRLLRDWFAALPAAADQTADQRNAGALRNTSA